MYLDAPTIDTNRGSRVAYLTRHFNDLQGLRFAPLWCGWLAVLTLNEIARFSPSHVLEINIALLMLFFVTWVPWINNWYRFRYGTVFNSAPRSDKLRLYLFMAFLLVSLATSLLPQLDAYKDFLHFWPIVFFILPSGLHPHPADRAVRLRFLFYGVALLSLLVLIGWNPLLHLHVRAVQAGVCAALLALSVYDHWLLNHLLRGMHGSFL